MNLDWKFVLWNEFILKFCAQKFLLWTEIFCPSQPLYLWKCSTMYVYVYESVHICVCARVWARARAYEKMKMYI